jgi:hypothetical protein
MRDNEAQMTDSRDWRLDNLQRLKGLRFVRAVFRKRRDDWDHEHCVGCWQKFAEFGNPPEVLHGGFREVERDEWVCPDCFEAFREELNWSVE